MTTIKKKTKQLDDLEVALKKVLLLAKKHPQQISPKELKRTKIQLKLVLKAQETLKTFNQYNLPLNIAEFNGKLAIQKTIITENGDKLYSEVIKSIQSIGGVLMITDAMAVRYKYLLGEVKKALATYGALCYLGPDMSKGVPESYCQRLMAEEHTVYKQKYYEEVKAKMEEVYKNTAARTKNGYQFKHDGEETFVDEDLVRKKLLKILAQRKSSIDGQYSIMQKHGFNVEKEYKVIYTDFQQLAKLIKGDNSLGNCAHFFNKIAQEYKRIEAAWAKYIDREVDKGETIVTTLKVIKWTSFTVVSIYTGAVGASKLAGTAVVEGIASVGGGAIISEASVATVASGAITAAGKEVVDGGATLLGDFAAGNKIDLDKRLCDILAKAFEAGIKSAVFGLLLKNKLIDDKILKVLSGKVLKKLGLPEAISSTAYLDYYKKAGFRVDLKLTMETITLSNFIDKAFKEIFTGTTFKPVLEGIYQYAKNYLLGKEMTNKEFAKKMIDYVIKDWTTALLKALFHSVTGQYVN